MTAVRDIAERSCRNADGSLWAPDVLCLTVKQAGELASWAARVYRWAVEVDRLCRQSTPDPANHGSLP